MKHMEFRDSIEWHTLGVKLYNLKFWDFIDGENIRLVSKYILKEFNDAL